MDTNRKQRFELILERRGFLRVSVLLMPTSEDWSDNGGQETPPIDAQVEHREEGTSLSFLNRQKE